MRVGLQIGITQKRASFYSILEIEKKENRAFF